MGISNDRMTFGHPVAPLGVRVCPIQAASAARAIPAGIRSTMRPVFPSYTNLTGKRAGAWMRTPQNPTADVPQNPPSVLERTT